MNDELDRASISCGVAQLAQAGLMAKSIQRRPHNRNMASATRNDRCGIERQVSISKGKIRGERTKPLRCRGIRHEDHMRAKKGEV